MRAVAVEDGHPFWRDRPTPAPGPGEIRIRVVYSALNRADLEQLRGRYPPPPGVTDVPGLECAGFVDAVGPGECRFHLGDPVCALLAGGGWAEHVVCPAGQALPLPRGVGLDGAAALPEVHATAWLNLVVEGGMSAGTRVLVHAGASGVGTAALQLARALGAEAVATASAGKLDACRAHGAVGAYDRRSDWAAGVRSRYPDGVDLVLDPVGATTLASDQAVLAIDGRLVIIGLLGGARAELDLGRLLVKRQRVVGSTLRSRSVAFKSALMAELERVVWPLLASGTVVPVIAEVHPMSAIEAACARLASDSVVGKVLLRVEGA